MKYTHLGRTGLKVSRLALGTMNFGDKSDEKESFAIMNRALELGINFFDTANRYGNPMGEGVTESIVGTWLAQSKARDQIVLATKLFGPMGPGANDGELSAYHIRAAAEASLRRLKTDRIDLYQMHHIDRSLPHPKSDLKFLDGDIRNLYFPPHRMRRTPWEEIWQAMGVLIGQGKVVYVGSSNFAAWNIAQANERAEKRSLFGLVSEQSKYNLMTRTIELEIAPVCRDYGLGLIPWSPLNGGALAGRTLEASGGRRSGLSLDASAQKQIASYEALCKELGEAPANVGLAWLLHNPVVTAPIIGPRTIAQLEGAVRATQIELSEEVLKRLDEIFPGPGNQAPEAYAW